MAAEFGAVGVRRSRLRRLCEDGDATAARLLPIVENPQRLNRYIAASQVGITLSGMVLGAYAEAAISPRIAPLLERWASLPADVSDSVASGGVLIALTTLSVVAASAMLFTNSKNCVAWTIEYGIGPALISSS